MEARRARRRPPPPLCSVPAARSPRPSAARRARPGRPGHPNLCRAMSGPCNASSTGTPAAPKRPGPGGRAPRQAASPLSAAARRARFFCSLSARPIGSLFFLSPHSTLQVRAIPVRKDDEVQIVRGTYKVGPKKCGGRARNTGRTAGCGERRSALPAPLRAPPLLPSSLTHLAIFSPPHPHPHPPPDRAARARSRPCTAGSG